MNLFQQFKKLLPPEEQTEVGTVLASANGHTTLQTFSGGIVKVKGEGVAVGSKAFFRAKELAGPAPDLPVFEVEV
ncbi:MAG: hypothetical protein WBH20_03265 [Oceanisphaera sp.]|uniref:hypothetical protein n=1 Tax=Oceanisphaera sp. TaxID=1929979 RepID=UPI003C74DA0E